MSMRQEEAEKIQTVEEDGVYFKGEREKAQGRMFRDVVTTTSLEMLTWKYDCVAFFLQLNKLIYFLFFT